MRYYETKNEDAIRCLLCRHYCTLKEGKNGICGINYNIEGRLHNTAYAHPSALNLDPIEKKPLYHFLPTTTSLSLGTVGCNFRCPFCQNYTISQTSHVDTTVTLEPHKVVALALEHKAKSISYTYNEPVIWYLYAKDIGVLAKEVGLKNLFVSSGYESIEVLEDMRTWVDGVNIDLKSFSHEYYKNVLKTDLDGVKESLIAFAQSDIWLEVTTLVIPEHNDSEEELSAMAAFIAKELGVEVPWHLSAFYPQYKMQDTPATPVDTLYKAREIAYSHGLKYVYIGNIMGVDNATYCPQCHEKLIQRDGYKTKIIGLKEGKCKKCANTIVGVWQ